jgi:uncharacterized membrane protein
MNMSWPGLLVIGATLIAIVLVLFWHPKLSWIKTNTSTNHQSTFTGFRDDDRYWSSNIFYNNPDDPALFVPKRFGFGWTLNFGHPQAKPFLITVAVMILLLGVVLPLGVTFLGGGSLHPSGCHTFGCLP